MRKPTLTAWRITHHLHDETLVATPLTPGPGLIDLVIFVGDGEEPSRALWRVHASRKQLLWTDVGQA